MEYNFEKDKEYYTLNNDTLNSNKLMVKVYFDHYNEKEDSYYFNMNPPEDTNLKFTRRIPPHIVYDNEEEFYKNVFTPDNTNIIVYKDKKEIESSGNNVDKGYKKVSAVFYDKRKNIYEEFKALSYPKKETKRTNSKKYVFDKKIEYQIGEILPIKLKFDRYDKSEDVYYFFHYNNIINELINKYQYKINKFSFIENNAYLMNKNNKIIPIDFFNKEFEDLYTSHNIKSEKINPEIVIESNKVNYKCQNNLNILRKTIWPKLSIRKEKNYIYNFIPGNHYVTTVMLKINKIEIINMIFERYDNDGNFYFITNNNKYVIVNPEYVSMCYGSLKNKASNTKNQHLKYVEDYKFSTDDNIFFKLYKDLKIFYKKNKLILKSRVKC